MKAWIDEMATLTVDVGSGWLSRYEFEQLSAGSIVRSSAEAGTGCVVRLNGDFFAVASVLVVDANSGVSGARQFCAMLESFSGPASFAPAPYRGDVATDLLPFSVRLGAVSVPMSALAGIGLKTILNLDRPCSTTEDAELVVAGISVAAGKVLVIGENMGFRVARMVAEPPRGNFPRTTGSVLAPLWRAEKVSDYDFTRPDRFTRRVVDRTASIHLDFLRLWQLRFPDSGDWRLSFVDQLNYGEWLDDPDRPGSAFVAFRSAELRRDYPRDASTRHGEPSFVEPANAAFPIDRKVLDDMREWIATRLEKRDLLPFQIAFDPGAAKLLDGDPAFDVALACLRNAWLSVADLRIGRAAGAPEAAVSRAPVFTDSFFRSFMILLVRFESATGGKIDVVYPDDLVEPYLPALGK
jgi:flagellar motor switch/type III secretory pathway protein FliN